MQHYLRECGSSLRGITIRGAKWAAHCAEERTVTVISVFLCLAIAIMVWQAYRSQSNLLRESAVGQAAQLSLAIREFRTLYTSEVATRVRAHGVEVTHDYATKENAIPLPATLSKMLGNRIAESDTGGSLRLYSDYPFPWRDDGGPRDVFEKDALGALRNNPSEPFYRFEADDGRVSLRYATADLMRKSCVSCHNSHAESPKTDWKVGDVRGVLEVTVPLDGAISTAQSGVRGVTALLVTTALFGIGALGLILGRIRRSNADLKSSQVRLAEASRIAETANESKSQFLANMSHEIRTPMTAILGYAEILHDNVNEPENLAAAETIRRNGRFLLDIINDILDLSKIEAGMLTLELIPTAIAELVAEVESLMQVRADEQGISLLARFEGVIPSAIRTDPTRLRQILVNLLGNAIKFTHEGRVELVVRPIQSERTESTVRIDVIDTGVGITEDRIAALFAPFNQADNSTTRKYGGTGLGLAISRRLARELGGDITVKSRLGEGSTFTLTLSAPVCEMEAPSESAADLAALRQSSIDVPLADDIPEVLDCHVLLAEDSPDNQRLIEAMLRKVGATLNIAENGRAAVDRVMPTISGEYSTERQRPQTYDMILMDMQMPEMDGLTATRYLREHGYKGPIIALTANVMSGDREECLKAGCDAFLPKPINRKLLLQTVARYVRGHASSAANDDSSTISSPV